MVINGHNATTTKCHYKTNVSTTGKNEKKNVFILHNV